MKKLITTVTYVFQKEITKEDIEINDGLMTLEEMMRSCENFTLQEGINVIEGHIDNNGYIGAWERKDLKMRWEDNDE